MTTIDITAKITARDSNTTDGRPGSVDADIFDADGDLIGEVTLVPNERGLLSTWGSPENWASSSLLRWASDLEDEDGDPIELRNVAFAVEAAVEHAAAFPT